MKNASYSHSEKANVFRKSYGDIHLTIVMELPKTSLKKSDRQDAVNVLKDEICNLLNDTELEKMLIPQESNN